MLEKSSSHGWLWQLYNWHAWKCNSNYPEKPSELRVCQIWHLVVLEPSLVGSTQHFKPNKNHSMNSHLSLRLTQNTMWAVNWPCTAICIILPKKTWRNASWWQITSGPYIHFLQRCPGRAPCAQPMNMLQVQIWEASCHSSGMAAGFS